MLAYLHAIGAYGRTANLADWQAGKDFRDAETGQYFSIRDSGILRDSLLAGIRFHDAKTHKVLFTVDL